MILKTHHLNREESPFFCFFPERMKPGWLSISLTAVLAAILLLTFSSCSDEEQGTLVVRWEVISPIEGDPTPCTTAGISHVHVRISKGVDPSPDKWPTYRFPCSQGEVRLTLKEGLYTVNILKEEMNEITEVSAFHDVEILSNTETDIYGIYPPTPIDSHDINIPWCGNGVIEAGFDEECDQGLDNSDTLPDHCRTNCLSSFCGDGIADSDETCDGSDLKGATCEDMDLIGDTPSCSPSCNLLPGECAEPMGDFTISWDIYAEDETTPSTCEDEDVETIRYTISYRDTSEVFEQGLIDCAEAQITIPDLPFHVYAIYLEGLSPQLELKASGTAPSHYHNDLEGSSLEIDLVAIPQ